jgi:hypothetical protein
MEVIHTIVDVIVLVPVGCFFAGYGYFRWKNRLVK